MLQETHSSQTEIFYVAVNTVTTSYTKQHGQHSLQRRKWRLTQSRNFTASRGTQKLITERKSDGQHSRLQASLIHLR